MQKGGKKKTLRKPQTQARPGKEHKMQPRPEVHNEYPGSGRLKDKVALITGGDSGIGRAVAVLFAKEGASIAIAYLNEHRDARETMGMVQETGQDCIIISGDLSKEANCKSAVSKTIKKFGRIDILVNNAALHWEEKNFEDITSDQLVTTFANNFFSYFWVTQAALPHIPEGGVIINTSSVTAYRGSPSLIDYASTKGAIVSFTRSLSANLVKKKIRVNGVAPGPIWTPLIASTFDGDKVASFGSDVPMERAGEPSEVAPAYLFLACGDASYVTGQFIHVNGGEIING
ncbi:SDR family oxidoreductase [Fulvivirgaceae bacterium PWU4]|uniref:SDR family oxidoreductase n=1 Tax=Chryseosolibacter histidini TaxID=2782349 RepID=A0AAP2GJU0_9BACT|nr:SDR family oxidoreductase [Chryseosolibacter histidini]MBT1698364.1 SDR family oxidoreductase [Chryseosolibacter histidini]